MALTFSPNTSMYKYRRSVGAEKNQNIRKPNRIRIGLRNHRERECKWFILTIPRAILYAVYCYYNRTQSARRNYVVQIIRSDRERTRRLNNQIIESSLEFAKRNRVKKKSNFIQTMRENVMEMVILGYGQGDITLIIRVSKLNLQFRGDHFLFLFRSLRVAAHPSPLFAPIPGGIQRSLA